MISFGSRGFCCLSNSLRLSSDIKLFCFYYDFIRIRSDHWDPFWLHGMINLQVLVIRVAERWFLWSVIVLRISHER
jgi:hypothetical protein